MFVFKPSHGAFVECMLSGDDRQSLSDHEGLQLQHATGNNIYKTNKNRGDTIVKIVIEDPHQFQGNIWFNIIFQF